MLFDMARKKRSLRSAQKHNSKEGKKQEKHKNEEGVEDTSKEEPVEEVVDKKEQPDEKADAEDIVVQEIDSLDSSEDSESAEDLSLTADDITSIYDLDDDADQVDMTTMDQASGRGRLWAILGGLLVVIALGVAAYLLWFTPSRSTTDVRFALEVDDKVASGDVVTLTTTFTNASSVSLDTAEVELFYPEGFEPRSSDIEPDDDRIRTWTVVDIDPGASVRIEVIGQLVGTTNENKEFSGLLTYRPTNFSQDFQISENTTAVITSSLIELDVDVASQVQSGQELVYTAEFTNTGTVPIESIALQASYPSGFSFAESSLDLFGSSEDEWRLETLEPDETQRLEIRGSLEGDSGETKELQLQVGVIEIDNSFNVQVEKTSEIVIVNPELELSLTAPEETAVGAALPLSVEVTNTSDVEIKDIEVRLVFEGRLFDEEVHTFDTINTIKAGKSKTLEYTTQLNEKAPNTNQELNVVARIEGAIVEGNSVSISNTDAAAIAVAGDVVASAFGRYYDDDLKKIGDGPIPPVVGETTEYVIQWEVTNAHNTLSDVQLTTSLPADVEWLGVASDGVEYTESTRQVSYASSEIAANGSALVTFRVAITPTADDLEGLMVLTNETVFSAADDNTGEALSETLSRITSDLPEDEGAAGKGVVIQ